VAAHADWSVDPRKRWMTVAVWSGREWQVAAPAPVGALETLFERLCGLAGGGAVALGVDFPVGLPRAYAAAREETDFPAFLRGLATPGDFFRVCATLDEVGAGRPFYPARGVRGMTRAGHAAALGLGGAEGLSRWCDRATAERPAGAPLFWTLGANQTGKAAITAWRDLLAPALAGGGAVRLWPFAGDFLSVLAPDVVTVAETYPAEAMRQVGLRMNGSKRRQADRAALADGILSALAARRAAPSAGLRAAIVDGFGADAAGEDRFDSVFGVLSVLGVLQEMRPDGIPDDPWLRRWEGWVLGQTALPVW
jgi:hypothetical protein